jgi:hypothetical protein
MHRIACGCFLILCFNLIGCASKPVERDNVETLMFGPQQMRLHPIFTQVKDWTGDGQPDGIEAELEFTDQFDDPTKAAGKVMFELYGYRHGYPDPRGERLVNPWVGSLQTQLQQHEHWNRTSRTYSFQLAMPGLSMRHTYVLTAMFEHSDGRRFFSRVILNGEQTEPTPRRPTLPPLPEPTTRPATP